jgi:hypothetical protein
MIKLCRELACTKITETIKEIQMLGQQTGDSALYAAVAGLFAVRENLENGTLGHPNASPGCYAQDVEYRGPSRF